MEKSTPLLTQADQSSKVKTWATFFLSNLNDPSLLFFSWFFLLPQFKVVSKFSQYSYNFIFFFLSWGHFVTIYAQICFCTTLVFTIVCFFFPLLPLILLFYSFYSFSFLLFFLLFFLYLFIFFCFSSFPFFLFFLFFFLSLFLLLSYFYFSSAPMKCLMSPLHQSKLQSSEVIYKICKDIQFEKRSNLKNTAKARKKIKQIW